jgi:3-deoxy-7-phosphoheptulonate synthase
MTERHLQPSIAQPELISAATSYRQDYQPVYSNPAALATAKHELRATTPVTTPAQIDDLGQTLEAIASGELNQEIIIDAGCAEPVDAHVPVATLVSAAALNRNLTLQVFPRATVIQRNRGQGVKPRSSFLEELDDGSQVVSFMGEGVNSVALDGRDPDPSRMVAMALQARDLEEGLRAATGEHVPAAHEALLTHYEESFIQTDPTTKKRYLLSTDLPWIGERTRRLDGPHVAMLSDIENPVGVKIGPKATPEDIVGLKDRLNPDSKAGKLTYMLRMGDNQVALRGVLAAIKQYAPESIVMYDIHGVTQTVDGIKVRSVPNTIEQVGTLSVGCGELGLKLHGLHLETMTDQRRLECVDHNGQLPTHPGNVDPQLNPAQKLRVLRETAPYLG